MAFSKTLVTLFMVTLTVSYCCAQSYGGVQGSSDEGYFSSMMSSISSMDWQAMLRSVVETAMQYFAAPINRVDNNGNRAFGEADVIISFIEQTPFLRYYVEAAHDYVVSGADFVNYYITSFFDSGQDDLARINTKPVDVSLSSDIRNVLSTNTFLADNVVVGAWQYLFWLISYCVGATAFGVYTILNLPDPDTLAKVRADQDIAADNLEQGKENNANLQDGDYPSYEDNSRELVRQKKNARHKRKKPESSYASVPSLDYTSYEYFDEPEDTKPAESTYAEPPVKTHSSYEKTDDDQKGDYQEKSKKKRPYRNRSKLYYSQHGYPSHLLPQYDSSWAYKVYGKFINFYNYLRDKVNSRHRPVYAVYPAETKPKKKPHGQYGRYPSSEEPEVDHYKTAAGNQYEAPSQETYEAPVKETYKAPVKGTYKAPVKGTYEAPVKGTYEAPVKETYKAPVEETYGYAEHVESGFKPYKAPMKESYQPEHVGLKYKPSKVNHAKPEHYVGFQAPKQESVIVLRNKDVSRPNYILRKPNTEYKSTSNLEFRDSDEKPEQPQLYHNQPPVLIESGVKNENLQTGYSTSQPIIHQIKPYKTVEDIDTSDVKNLGTNPEKNLHSLFATQVEKIGVEFPL